MELQHPQGSALDGDPAIAAAWETFMGRSPDRISGPLSLPAPVAEESRSNVNPSRTPAVPPSSSPKSRDGGHSTLAAVQVVAGFPAASPVGAVLTLEQQGRAASLQNREDDRAASFDTWKVWDMLTPCTHAWWMP